MRGGRRDDAGPRRASRHRAGARPRAGARRPGAAWEVGPIRRGAVPPGAFMRRAGRHVLEAELPDVLRRAGRRRCAAARPADRLPPPIADRAPRPGDERFVTMTARRPGLEQVLAPRRGGEAGLDVQRGAQVAALGARPAGDPAGHRRAHRRGRACWRPTSWSTPWAAARRCPAARRRRRRPGRSRRPRTAASSTTRATSAADGRLPVPRGPLTTRVVLAAHAPADAGTWSVTVYAASAGPAAQRLRDAEALDRGRARLPAARALARRRAATAIMPMGGVVDR